MSEAATTTEPAVGCDPSIPPMPAGELRSFRAGRNDCGASWADSDVFAQVAIDRSRTSQHVAGFHGQAIDGHGQEDGRAAVPARLADFVAGCAAVYGCPALTVEGSQSLDADIPGRNAPQNSLVGCFYGARAQRQVFRNFQFFL